MLVSLVVLCLALQSPLRWQPHQGANRCTVEGDRVVARQVGDTRTNDPAYARTDLSIADHYSWSVGFVVSFPSLGEHGGRVSLEVGDKKVAWVGADKWYRAMSVYVGERMVYTQGADERPHAIRFVASGGQIESFVDGRSYGKAPFNVAPTALHVGSGPGGNVGTQTEVAVSGVSVTSPLPSPTGTAPASRSSLAPARLGLVDGRFRTVLGADRSAPPPAKVGAPERLRVLARSAVVHLAPGSTVELAPANDRPDFRPTQIGLFAGGKSVSQTQVLEGKPLPAFSYDLPAGLAGEVRLTVVAEDDSRRRVELQRVVVCPLVAGESPGVRADLKDQRLSLVPPEGTRTLYAFLAGEFLGKVAAKGALEIDARRLPPGQHALYTIAEGEGGEISAPKRSLVEITPRFRITSPHEGGVFSVEGARVCLPIAVETLPGGGISSVRVYLNGSLVEQKTGPSFECRLPVESTPSGEALVEVVGVGTDGVPYPAERLVLRVRNPFLDSVRARGARSTRLVEMAKRMSVLDQQVVYWYERACDEPEFRTYMVGRTIYASDEFGLVASVGYVTSLTVPGDAGRHLAECRAAIARRAELRLEMARLQRDLGLRDAARSSYEQAILEAGEGSGVGSIASQELKRL